MKITGITEASKFLNRVDSRREEQKHGQHHQQKKDENPKDDGKGADAAELQKAVQKFEADEQTQACGLHAFVEGAGPGLRVVLKDVNGSVIRQFTGEEFLKIRQGTNPKDTHGRGKILDQKL